MVNTGTIPFSNAYGTSVVQTMSKEIAKDEFPLLRLIELVVDLQKKVQHQEERIATLTAQLGALLASTLPKPNPHPYNPNIPPYQPYVRYTTKTTSNH